ncbi:MAG: helix-turn-helix domain-containing protein [Bacteroidota bacterium]
MSIYTTPLQIGYFFSILMWMLFLIRGYREQRLSDRLLGWIMFLLAMELQDYTFGFAGINVLWNELNGFPRGVQLLFGPIVYFYFRVQVNRKFRLGPKHLWHFLPYTVAFLYEFVGFVQGPEGVQRLQASTHYLVLSYVNRVLMVISYGYYLSRCIVIYKKYRIWSLQQFSNNDLISFRWFRNFIYAMIFWLVFREVMNVLDLLLDLDFYQDWWWNLALVAVALYVGLAGYEQQQPAKIRFEEVENLSKVNQLTSELTSSKSEIEQDKAEVAERLNALMKEDKLFIQADLSLHELARHLQVNASVLSATINQVFGQNFNDFINTLRIEEFVRMYKEDTANRFTLLSLALDSGFNSKATFNRAFKKIKGNSPRDFLQDLK